MYICLQTFNTSLLRLKIANTEITVECLHIHYAFQGLAFRIGLPHHQLQTEPLNRNLTNVSFNCESSQATREVSIERLSGKEPATET